MSPGESRVADRGWQRVEGSLCYFYFLPEVGDIGLRLKGRGRA